MGRQKRLMMKIDNPNSRHITYYKRRDGILKKASELSVLCDADVGLLMFSPSGRLTNFSSNGRIEDVFLRYVEQPNDQRGGPVSNEDYFYQRLRELKHEGEMLEKLSKVEALQEKLQQISQHHQKAQEKMKFYNPDLMNITSVYEAQGYQQFLTDSLQHVEKLKAELLGKQIMVQESGTVEVTAPTIKNMGLMTETSAEASRKRNFTADDHDQPKTTLPAAAGPHLTLDILKVQSQWNLQNAMPTPRLNIK